MAANDIRLIQENGTNDFFERVLTAVSAGKALLINGSNIPELRIIEIADINGLATQLAAKINSTEKGATNGIATLGADGKVPSTQFPEGMLGSVTYQGIWNASTNTPTIPAASSSNKGYYYVVNVAGSTSIDGITDWKLGDWIISNGTAWEKVDTTDMVTSVNGQVGAVVIGIAEISGLQSALDLKANLAGPTFTGTVTLPSTTSIGLVSATELSYLDGVTSAIQTQLDSKLKWVSAPATPTSTGTAGEASYDNDDLYICVATNSWKRMPLAIWT